MILSIVMVVMHVSCHGSVLIMHIDFACGLSWYASLALCVCVRPCHVDACTHVGVQVWMGMLTAWCTSPSRRAPSSCLMGTRLQCWLPCWCETSSMICSSPQTRSRYAIPKFLRGGHATQTAVQCSHSTNRPCQWRIHSLSPNPCLNE